MSEHKKCYGEMFPEVMQPVASGVHSGSVFSFSIENIGLARGWRQVRVDRDAWDQCLECNEFNSCHKLSAGKLMLQIAVFDA